MKRLAVAVLIVWLAPVYAHAGGFASNADFIVNVAAQGEQNADGELAKEIARRASEYRSRISKEWLDEELPPSVGRTCLSVLLTDDEDLGQTWPKNEITGEYNNVHLSTSREGALGGTLAHEVAHTVLATRFPHPQDLPVWVVEGVASRYDDEKRVAIRRRIISWYARTGNWPSLEDVLNAESIPPYDQAEYAVASSLTEFLLTKGDKQKFLEFAQRGRSDGWDSALTSTYGIRNVQQLQIQWQDSNAPQKSTGEQELTSSAASRQMALSTTR